MNESLTMPKTPQNFSERAKMRSRFMLSVCLGLTLLVAGCNLPEKSTPTTAGADYIRTAAARTLDAVGTTMASPRGTPIVVTVVPTVPATMPASTTAPSLTPPAEATPTKGTSLPCDQVSFVRDISIPDGTLLYPGTPFTKTWELKNTGTCAWNAMYLLVFANEGDLMGAAVSKPLITSGAVQPGELVRVSVDLIAPAKIGDAKSSWRLRSPAGVDFGPSGKAFWASIKVADTFLLQDNLCKGEWKNASADLACPGKSGDAKGAVFTVANPKFASGYQDNEPAMQLEPQQINDGLIVGKFPPMMMTSAAPFLKTVIGCAYEAKACDAKVTLTTQVGGEPEQTLGDWSVAYTKEWVNVKIDLAAKGLVGKAVTFRFYVRANGSANQDRVLILGPAFYTK